MIILCAWHPRYYAGRRKVLGLKAPWWPWRRLIERTHGICDQCRAIMLNRFINAITPVDPTRSAWWR